MFNQLPSVAFQPKFYSGEVSRWHLAFFYDLVAMQKPGRIVTLGFSDGQIHFTWCQAARERALACQCLTVRRENASDDEEWQKAIAEAEEFYPDLSVLRTSGGAQIAAEEMDESVDILLIDACDRGEIAQMEWEAWRPKLAPNATILFHGLNLERTDSLRPVWEAVAQGRKAIEFSSGLGLGAILPDDDFSRQFHLPNESKNIERAYAMIGARIGAEGCAARLRRENSALQLRQVWLDTVLAGQRQAQETAEELTRQVADLRGHAERAQAVMDDQKYRLSALDSLLEERARELKTKTYDFEELRRDRGKAQVIMDTLAEQLRSARDAHRGEIEKQRLEIEKIKEELKAKKRVLTAAKVACRKNGRCFRVSIETKDKPRRSIPEKIIRELKRIPVNLSGKKHRPAAKVEAKAPKIVEDRYARWIAEHEPDVAGLVAQRVAAARLTSRPKISLLLLIHDTPQLFLRELRASLAAQTYDDFEICAVDAASKNIETRTFLQEWRKEEARLQLEVLQENFGIAENTNRALAIATGDYIACIDHDDLLAPFALYELARAINENRSAEIFYSDEDRLGADGKRHSPFFKPEWNPELLLSFMYMGHLTAYRRDLVERAGKFRKEFDFSQDYDFALRATELAREIIHVPYVLYHWREHPASGSAGGKPHARASNLAALGDAMKRRGLAAEIMAYPTSNRARLTVSAWPKVSIVVPTDSAARGKACVEELPRLTSYPDLEIVIVANSLLVEALESLTSARSGFRFVRYDQPFNFSEKCNLGAAAASGTRLIFLNDDVAGAESDWIENLIEQLENPEVGGVSPKLLYANGRIQHAGLVTGVREFVGTACHQWPGDSTDYFNFAQSLRAASALSAACLAMRRDDFFSVGQFDAVNTPVAHSDFDLSFKIRAAGMRCVYTPFVSMTHRGHESIGMEGEGTKIARAERPSIFLLKRWPGYAGHDPYFPENMRDWLYADSPTPVRISVPNEYKINANRADLLFVSHDLSLSGAPMMLFHAALWCRNHGDFVVVTAPTAGPLAQKFEAEGIPLIIDPLVEAEHESYKRFAREFHCVIANTIFSAPAVRALAGENVPVAFWLHEPSSVGEHYMRADEKLRAALPQADVLIAPSAWTAAFYQPFNDRTAKCLRNAIPDFCGNESTAEKAAASFLRILLLGSLESRKGQDIFAAAIALLPPDVLQKAQFQIAGRRLDPEFSRKLGATSEGLQNFSITGAQNHAQALALLREADVVVSASRDEAMPTVTILEAMCLGKAIVATAVGGAEEVMMSGENSLLVRPENSAVLAAALQRMIEDPALVRQLGAGARATYEKNFTIDRFGREFREIIDQTMRSRHQPAAVLA